MISHKRVAIGNEVVEWSEEDDIARRYKGKRTMLPLSQWETGKLILRWQMSPTVRARFEELWIAQGQAVVNR